jgi:hypothetical protein
VTEDCLFKFLSFPDRIVKPWKVHLESSLPTLLLNKEGGVSHYALTIIYIKKYLKAKEELWKLNSNTSPCKNIIFKNSSKKKKPKSFKIL